MLFQSVSYFSSFFLLIKSTKRKNSYDIYYCYYRYIDHAEFFHQVPDEYLADILPVAKKIAKASKLDQYNVLQVITLNFDFITFFDCG